MRKVVEEEDREGEIVTTYALRISRLYHAGERHTPGRHRPARATALFRPAAERRPGRLLAAGLVVDGLEEPTFPTGSPAKRPLSWENLAEFPPVLVVRARPGGIGSSARGRRASHVSRTAHTMKERLNRYSKWRRKARGLIILTTTKIPTADAVAAAVAALPAVPKKRGSRRLWPIVASSGRAEETGRSVRYLNYSSPPA